MVISQPQGIILHIIIVLHQRCLNCSECFQRHLIFYTCNYNIRVTHRNVNFLSVLFYTNQMEGSSADYSLFILSLHALALHLAVKILLQIFYNHEDLGINLTYICQLYFPPECQQGHTHTFMTILLSENIPNI